ncbi:MAG: HD-GYP domain-containing protein [Spirochaetales bacterium]|nr:MAG: HD-GYP domain-containing protein [Spirochaetales bacterium]
MKKKYPVDKIKSGTTFTADAYMDADNLLVPAGVPVRAKDLDSLKQWGITYVYSEGSQVEPEAHKKEATHAKRGLAAFVDHKLYSEYADMVDRLKAIMDKISLAEKIEAKTVDRLAQDVLAMVRIRDSQIVSAILSADVHGYDLARAGINCSILSVIMGQTLKLPAHRLTHLAAGAMLHDVGMLRIPEVIVKKKGSLSPEEAQKMHAHPLLSYRIITRELQYPDDVGLIGLQHHERWDGGGYPRRSAGADIDILARIASVADAFEAMVSHKPYRNSMIGYAAMKNLLSDNSRRFDPDVLKAFIRSMGIYPIGSLVVLNNAAIARVLETHADAPLRPKIKIIVDEFGKHFKDDTGEQLDLLSEKTLFIARAIDPKELEAAP